MSTTLKVGVPIIVEPGAEIKRGRSRKPRGQKITREDARALDQAFGNGLPATDVERPDLRDSERARAIRRGTTDLLRREDTLVLDELVLPNKLRVDLVAIFRNGEIWIVEIKSSVEDFRRDKKWREYQEYCSRLLFSTTPNLRDVFPQHLGLIRANCYGGVRVRKPRRYRIGPTNRERMRECIREHLLLQVRQGRMSGRDYADWFLLRRERARCHILGEWFTKFRPCQRMQEQQAEAFAIEASERYRFRCKGERHKVILDWLKHFEIASVDGG